ncbi:hypothetical protein IAT40_007321 [Kwoniella sp. CBS 6097]
MSVDLQGSAAGSMSPPENAEQTIKLLDEIQEAATKTSQATRMWLSTQPIFRQRPDSLEFTEEDYARERGQGLARELTYASVGPSIKVTEQTSSKPGHYGLHLDLPAALLPGTERQSAQSRLVAFSQSLGEKVSREVTIFAAKGEPFPDGKYVTELATELLKDKIDRKPFKGEMCGRSPHEIFTAEQNSRDLVKSKVDTFKSVPSEGEKIEGTSLVSVPIEVSPSSVVSTLRTTNEKRNKQVKKADTRHSKYPERPESRALEASTEKAKDCSQADTERREIARSSVKQAYATSSSHPDLTTALYKASTVMPFDRESSILDLDGITASVFDHSRYKVPQDFAPTKKDALTLMSGGTAGQSTEGEKPESCQSEIETSHTA